MLALACQDTQVKHSLLLPASAVRQPCARLLPWTHVRVQGNRMWVAYCASQLSLLHVPWPRLRRRLCMSGRCSAELPCMQR